MRRKVTVGGFTFNIPRFEGERLEKLIDLCKPGTRKDPSAGWRSLENVLHYVLHELAIATNLIDDEDVFKEWLQGLPLLPTLERVMPKVYKNARISRPQQLRLQNAIEAIQRANAQPRRERTQ